MVDSNNFLPNFYDRGKTNKQVTINYLILLLFCLTRMGLPTHLEFFFPHCQNFLNQAKHPLWWSSHCWVLWYRCHRQTFKHFVNTKNHFQGSGPFSSYILSLTSYKVTGVAGSCISSIAFILTGAMLHTSLTNILLYYLITGAMSGLGLGLLYMSAKAIVNEWFDKRLGLATGLANAGSGVGQLALAPLLVLALEHLGLSFTFLVLGSVTSVCVLLGLALAVPNTDENQNKVTFIPFVIHYTFQEGLESKPNCNLLLFRSKTEITKKMRFN